MHINIKDILEQDQKGQLNTDTSGRINVAEILGGETVKEEAKSPAVDTEQADAKVSKAAAQSADESPSELEPVIPEESAPEPEPVITEEPPSGLEPEIAEEPVFVEETAVEPEPEVTEAQAVPTEPIVPEETVLPEGQVAPEPPMAETEVLPEEPIVQEEPAPELADSEPLSSEPPTPEASEPETLVPEEPAPEPLSSEPITSEEPASEPLISEPSELAPPEPAPAEPAGKSHFARFGAVYGNILLMALLIAFTIFYTTMTPRTIHAVINGEQQEIETTKFHVVDALREDGLDYCDEDYLSVVPEAYVTDGMSLELVHAKDFTVTADGKTIEYKSLEATVGDALKDKGIKVGKIDIVEPDVGSELADGDKIVVKRVVIKEETVEEEVDFETITEEDESLAEGKTKVKTEGKKGKDEVVYKITYTDGKETKRKELSRKNLVKPVSEVVAKGTAVEYNGTLYKRKMTVKAYSYTGGGRTATGTRARVGEIAVDPRVIPLGTTVYIPGVGERRAEDTGGNIKGKTIDIYMNSKSACRRWGRRTITIYLK